MLTADAGERWTIVHDEPGERVRRYPVPGGWLYQVQAGFYTENDDSMWGSPVFVSSEATPAKEVWKSHG